MTRSCSSRSRETPHTAIALRRLWAKTSAASSPASRSSRGRPACGSACSSGPAVSLVWPPWPRLWLSSRHSRSQASTALWLAAERANVLARSSSNAERRARYRADIAAVAGALQLNQTDTARRLLDGSPEELRNWEWRYLDGKLDNCSVAFEPPHASPGRVLLSPDCTRVLYTAGRESVLHLRAVIPDREIAALTGHSAEVLSIAWSKNGRRVASSSADRTLRLWDGTSGQPLAVLRDHAGPVVKMYFNDDASRLAIHSSGPDVQIWEAARGVLQSTLRGANVLEVVTFSPDGKRLAVGRPHQVQIWDVDSGVELPPLSCGTARASALAFSPDGTRLAAGTDYPQNRIWLWETATARLFATMDGHTNTVCGLEFSPDGRRIVSTSHDQSVRLWDSSTGQSISKLQGHTATVTGDFVSSRRPPSCLYFPGRLPPALGRARPPVRRSLCR